MDVDSSTLDAVASAACSYSCESMTFDSAIKSLFQRVGSMSPPRAPGTDEPEKPWWKTCVGNLEAATNRAANVSGFKKMFEAFFDSHSDSLCAPIFDSDGRPVDGFFKSSDLFAFPSDAERHAKVTSATLPSENKGPVVYYSMSVGRLYNVCLPIGEMYRSAIQLYIAASADGVRDTPGNQRRKLLPTLTLLDFFAVLYYSIPETNPKREKIHDNLVDLCDAAEAQAPGTGPGAKTAQAPGIDSLLGMVTGMLGSQGGGSQITEAIGGFSGMMKSVYAKMLENGAIPSDAAAASDPADFVDRICTTFQSPEIKEQFVKSSLAASEAARSLGLIMPDAEPKGQIEEP